MSHFAPFWHYPSLIYAKPLRKLITRFFSVCHLNVTRDCNGLECPTFVRALYMLHNFIYLDMGRSFFLFLSQWDFVKVVVLYKFRIVWPWYFTNTYDAFTMRWQQRYRCIDRRVYLLQSSRCREWFASSKPGAAAAYQWVKFKVSAMPSTTYQVFPHALLTTITTLIMIYIIMKSARGVIIVVYMSRQYSSKSSRF